MRPIRLASSRSARKAYLNTALFLATSATLFGLAIVAYVLFYVNYIPKIGIEREVHLQYGYVPTPCSYLAPQTHFRADIAV